MVQTSLEFITSEKEESSFIGVEPIRGPTATTSSRSFGLFCCSNVLPGRPYKLATTFFLLHQRLLQACYQHRGVCFRPYKLATTNVLLLLARYLRVHRGVWFVISFKLHPRRTSLLRIYFLQINFVDLFLLGEL